MTMTRNNPKTAAIGLSDGQSDDAVSPRTRNAKYASIAGGLLLAAVVYFIMPADIGHQARAVGAVAVLMGAWWITEAVPIPVTAMLPMALFPLIGVAELADVGPSYAANTVLLLFGGFLLALAVEHWGLHQRIALNIVRIIGTKPANLVGGFMLATVLLSMWMSNTATAMLMIPMGKAVLKLVKEQTGENTSGKKSNFGIGLMLAIAYGASIGGFGTPIGSPVNVIAMGYIRETLGYDLTFLDWMLVGVPAALILTVVGWVLLTKVILPPEIKSIPGGKELFRDELRKLGPMSSGEMMIAGLFGLTALAWVLTPILFPDSGVSDAVIAVVAGLLTFLIPARPKDGVMLLGWKKARNVPFDILLLVGGGLALSVQIVDSGLADWIGTQVEALDAVPYWVLVVVVVVMVNLLTEFTSSTATTAAFVPVVAGVAASLGHDPVLFVFATSFSALCSFMMPASTPPNAIAFSTGAMTMGQIVRTGIWFNIASATLVVVLVLWVIGPVLGL